MTSTAYRYNREKKLNLDLTIKSCSVASVPLWNQLRAHVRHVVCSLLVLRPGICIKCVCTASQDGVLRMLVSIKHVLFLSLRVSVVKTIILIFHSNLLRICWNV